MSFGQHNLAHFYANFAMYFATGSKYTTLSKIESGVVTKPTIYIMAKIAKALDVVIDDLIK
jgi:transcriptional regulator with XRE-family HTH domain